MKIFLTGGTGFVGRNVVDDLLANVPDLELRCLVRNPQKTQTLPKDSRLVLIAGDLLQPQTYAAALIGVDIVIHTAALVSLKNGPEFYAANVEATKQLLAAAQNASALKRFVFTGSISSYEREFGKPVTGPITEESTPYPSTDYGKSKLEAQRLVETSGLPYSVLIPSYIYGPHPRPNSSMDRVIYDVRDQKPYTRMPLPGRATEIYAPNLAAAIRLCAMDDRCANETFFIGGENPVKVGDAYAAIAEALGMAYHSRPVSPATLERLKNLVYLKRPGEAFVKVLFEDYFWCSPQKLFRLTGWRPTHTLREGIGQTLDWYRLNHRL